MKTNELWQRLHSSGITDVAILTSSTVTSDFKGRCIAIEIRNCKVMSLTFWWLILPVLSGFIIEQRHTTHGESVRGDGAQTFARLWSHPDSYSEQPKHILWMLCVHVTMHERKLTYLVLLIMNILVHSWKHPSDLEIVIFMKIITIVKRHPVCSYSFKKIINYTNINYFFKSKSIQIDIHCSSEWVKTSIGYFSGNAVAHRSVIFMALKVFSFFGVFFAVISVVIIFSVVTVFLKHLSWDLRTDWSWWFHMTFLELLIIFACVF